MWCLGSSWCNDCNCWCQWLFWVVLSIFCFYPYLVKWSNLTNIFQMVCNHQLAIDNKRAIQDVCECSSCSACRCRLRMKWMWVQEIKVSCFLAFAKSTGVGQGGFEFAVQLAGFSMNLSFGWVLNFYILNLWHWWSHRQKHQSEKQTHIRQGVQDPWRTL